jgi:hypothetical protein
MKITKSQKVFLTSELSNGFKLTLKELALFEKSEIIASADWIGRKYDENQIVSRIIASEHDLILTSSEKLANGVKDNCQSCKIIVIQSEMIKNPLSFLSYIHHIKAFLKSKSQIFNL